MSALYALLWKEGREILPKVLVGVALAALVCLMRNNVDFNRSYAAGFEDLITGGLVVMVIVLAMDAIARERSTGSLSFLLDKPVAGATVLTVKFLLGLGGLLLVALMAWATVYIDLASLEVEREYLAYKLVTVQSVDYASMVALSFTQFALLYALIFIGSVVTDHPFKGASPWVLRWPWCWGFSSPARQRPFFRFSITIHSSQSAWMIKGIWCAWRRTRLGFG